MREVLLDLCNTPKDANAKKTIVVESWCSAASRREWISLLEKTGRSALDQRVKAGDRDVSVRREHRQRRLFFVLFIHREYCATRMNF